MSIKANYSSIRPSLDLNFAGSKTVDPRVTFTRASTATYYDGKTVAKAEENLLTWSQGFDNAVWVKTGIAVTANNEVAPDGTTTAETITATADNATITQAVTVIATEHQYSIYLKRKTGEGVVEIQSVAGTWTAVTLTTSWQRFNVATSPTAGSRTSGVRIATLGDEIVAWGAQLEQRDQATAYTPTTDQPITRYQPVLKTAAANTPRIDHDPITGECKGLLIEEQRTNLLTYSSDFDNAGWVKTNVTVRANSVFAPDGTLTADKIVSANGISGYIFRGVTGLVASSNYTQSIYLKAGEISNVDVYMGALGAYKSVRVNLLNGSVAKNESYALPSSYYVLSVGNGWYRLVMQDVTGSSQTSGNYTYVQTDAVGDGYSGIYIWGAQLETGAFPTSYIPTASVQVTRAADNAAMTGTNFSSWYRQGEGTLVADAEYYGHSGSYSYQIILGNSPTALDNIISLGTAGGRKLGRIRTNSNDQAYFDISGSSVQEQFKQAIAFKANDASYSQKGSSALTSSLVIIPSVSGLYITTYAQAVTSAGLTIKRITYYPKRLSNANLQSLSL